ncbi:uncharacterized protein N7525_010535 [Penicillium rubens]|uniref:uncharacterized protein n=1 Tax=Penicillium rubens TaxID=1108849 RepID=UPI002A59B7E4|nr:uncharacterized protein N7525_010535 [Penicillium rubens]KAJ5821251.1 hypothetical protein N7525_010535 [Penicillium rubens]
MKKKTPLRKSRPFKELLRGLASIHLDPKYSDLTIVCGDKEYAVHKCIVCPRSKFFAKACDSGFEESVTNRVVLEEKPDLIERMIEYLYTLDYHLKVHPPETELSGHPDGENAEDSLEELGDTDEEAATACNTLSLHILMYSFADRLLIHGLKALSKDKVEKELALVRLDSSTFPHIISGIYSSTPESDRGLRDLALQMTMDNLVALRSAAGTGEESGPMAFPDSLAKSTPQFSSDLVVEMMNRTVAKPMRFTLLTPSTLARRNICQSTRPTIAESPLQTA